MKSLNEDTRFLVTEELGKLAKWLRILGYDTEYHEHKDPANLVIQALREKRVLLTRKALLAKHKGITVIVLERDHVEEQLDQLLARLQTPPGRERLFQRCVECNVPLEKIAKEKARVRVPEYIYKTHEEFKICAKCQKVFWKGSHWAMVEKWLKKAGL